MKRKLKITKEFANQNRTIVLSQGAEIQKFSVSKDMFEDKVNYIIKVNNSPLLLPGEYAEIVYDGGEGNTKNQE